MSHDGNALGLGWPKSRILPPCLTGAHKEDCDRLCAEAAKNTGLEVPECGCRCHGRKPGNDGDKMNDQALGPDPVLTRLPNGHLEISWPNGRGRSCEASPDLVEQWVAQTNDLRAGLAVRDEALAEIAALHVEGDRVVVFEAYYRVCAGCRSAWPCETQRILSSLERSLDPYRDDKEQQ